MQIECTTTSAAAVLFVLIDAQLWMGKAFHIAGPSLPQPPIRFTVTVHLPAQVVDQLQLIPDISIMNEHGA
jgi:hypothetical protein